MRPYFTQKLLPVIFALACLNFGCGEESKPVPVAETKAVTDTVDKISEETPSSPTKVEPVSGPTITKKMACGVTVKVRENGMEAKLLAILEDKSSKANQDAWIDFDQIAFEDGKPNLIMSSSANQMITLSQIIKCFPSSRLKIGINPKSEAGKAAYTKLAAERIIAVKATLIGLGVTGANIESEVFQIQNPSNGTGNTSTQPLALQVLAK